MGEHTPAPSPSRAVYGFAMFLCFNVFFLLYLVWAIVPEKYFQIIGFDFLPQRYWAVSIPIYILTVLMIFAFIIYPSLGLLMTPDISDLRTITDESGKKNNGAKLLIESTDQGENKTIQCVCVDPSKCWKEYHDLGKGVNVNKCIPVLKDLNIWDVSEQLYL